MQAAFSGNLEAVKALIAAKADINTANHFGQTALSVAMDRGKSECVKALKDAGAVEGQSRPADTVPEWRVD
jgi:ankyrin repeat protein